MDKCGIDECDCRTVEEPRPHRIRVICDMVVPDDVSEWAGQQLMSWIRDVTRRAAVEGWSAGPASVRVDGTYTRQLSAAEAAELNDGKEKR